MSGKKTAPESEETKTRRRTKSKLQRRFLLGVGVIFLCFCIFSAVLVYFHEKRVLEEVAHAKSELVLAAVEANRSYVQEVLRPAMYERMGKDAFVLEAMSTSYVSRAVMDRFKATLPEYGYRRVSLNARNPNSEPTRFEAELISHFASHPEEPNRQGILVIDGRPHFLQARPVAFTDSCMHCHGDPDQAPSALLTQYGRERGFGYKPGDVAGLTAVSIPVDIALARIKERAFSVFATSIFALSILYLLVCFFFNRVVVQNLRDLLEIFRHGLRDENELQLLRAATAKDEIGELNNAAETMVSHLHRARSQLEEYTRNLEVKVAERTGALEESKRQIKEKEEKTRRSLRLLTTIAELTTRATHPGEIFPKVLRQILSVVPATGRGPVPAAGQPHAAGAPVRGKRRQTCPPLLRWTGSSSPWRHPSDAKSLLCEA